MLDAVGDRGYRLVNATIGAVAQNVYIAAAALGLGCGVALGFDNVSYIEQLGLARRRVPAAAHDARRRAARLRRLPLRDRLIDDTAMGAHWTSTLLFMVRVAGLPVERCEPLRCPAAAAWAEEVLARTSGCARAGGAARRALAALIGGHDDEPARADAWSGCAATVFNNRLPAERTPRSRWPPTLPTRLAAEAWRVARRPARGWSRSAHGAPRCSPPRPARSRAALRRLAAEPRLRSGLLLASPIWRPSSTPTSGRPGGRSGPTKAARKIERSALRYVYRTAGKPSPFSTFTGVALGRFAHRRRHRRAAGRAGGAVDESWTEPASGSAWSRSSRLADAVLADPGRRADLPVVPASGWGRDDDRVRYVRRWVTAGDDDTAVTFDAARDQLFFLRRSGILERLLGAASSERGSRATASWPPGSAADRGAPAEDAEQYLAALLDLGMLQVPAAAPPTSTPPTRCAPSGTRCARSAGRGRSSWPTGSTDRSAAWTATPTRTRPAGACCSPSCAAGSHAVGGAGRRSGRRCPRTLLYEDVRPPAERCTLRPGRVDLVGGPPARGRGADAARVRPDPAPSGSPSGFFLARFGAGGRCEDLLSLVHDFHEDIYDEYQSYTARRTPFDEPGGTCRTRTGWPAPARGPGRGPRDLRRPACATWSADAPGRRPSSTSTTSCSTAVADELAPGRRAVRAA